ncbi:lytic murein transglycosylase [Candidatus Nomurabacteria bacterium]|nr:lytic murein transglycosylase [Candidatus Nomurabacteria bacterium]
MTSKKVIVFILLFLISFYFTGQKVSADFDCLTLTSSSNQSDKDFCRNELSQIEAQLADLLKKQDEQKKQTGTLKGDVDYLTSQINALKTKIKARALVIAQLKVSIKEKTTKIVALSDKIDREHESLAQLLRNTNEFDNENLVHLVLSDKNMSSFYSDLESYVSIKKAIKKSVELITGVKVETEVQKKDLQTKQDAETNAKVELETAQKKVAQSETEKKQLLSISKQKESEYAKLAAEKKVRADKIRAALFQLRDTKAIPFGTALNYANLASQKTGVRPAFILAILTQESNLGTDQGSCYLTNFDTGEGASSKSGKIFKNVMHPTRDIPPFISITKDLGRDPYKTLVSCPIGGYGYGGAMGPAQFIASTWSGLESKIARYLDVANPDPWEPRDAFMASAVFLADLGADAGTYTSEKTAACRYYGGGKSCTSVTTPYGVSVMKKATDIQTNIDFLSTQ